MVKPNFLLSALGAILVGPILASAQTPTPVAPPRPVPVPAPVAPSVQPAPIEPPVENPTVAPIPGVPAPGAPVGVNPVGVPGAPVAPSTELPAVANAPQVFEFQGEEVGLVLRTLARAARMNIVVSPKVTGTVVLRLEDKTPREAIMVIVEHSGFVMDERNGVYSIKTQEERAKEPTIPKSFTFSYATAEKVKPLLDKQLTNGGTMSSEYDQRTNTIFFRETETNMEKVMEFLQTVDKPTEQVMIEARLVEVTANPQQSYGINWGGVLGSASQAQTFRYGGSAPNPTGATQNFPQFTQGGNALPASGIPNGNVQSVSANLTQGTFQPFDFLLGGSGANALGLLGGQFAILSAPQLSATLRLLNEDRDAEFLANPRVVTANNQKAEIKITRSQPVPQLNFNEQTAQAVFSGFQDKEFGNTLVVTPVINKDNFISLSVKPEISNKVGDASFTFSGATVFSPIIDKRTLESNVLIRSGDTLAIGGLLQDEVSKGRTKVPVLGDVPFLGHLFTERLNSRTKRNLLVFVTPTVLQQGYGTGLEDQVSGIRSAGETYADPNGWRNNAKGAIRLVPTSNRQVAADYPKPGIAPAPKKARAVRR